jgi:hypothetical protein
MLRSVPGSRDTHQNGATPGLRQAGREMRTRRPHDPRHGPAETFQAVEALVAVSAQKFV